MMSRHENRRRFIRHPMSIPVACRRESSAVVTTELRDLSHGGMCFMSDSAYEAGDIIAVKFPSLPRTAPIRGEVVWTLRVDGADGSKHLTGLRFLDEEDHFRGRLIEQICHIENYRLIQSARYGREIPHSVAAQEWIEREASRFPV